MQKFGLSKEDREAGRGFPLLSDRRNIVVIADETTSTASSASIRGQRQAPASWPSTGPQRSARPRPGSHLLSGGEQRILRLSASLAEGIPVDLRDTSTGLDQTNLERHQLFFDRMKGRRAASPVRRYDRRGAPRQPAPAMLYRDGCGNLPAHADSGG